MTLSNIATRILDQLADLVEQIQEADFTKSCETLSGATIGQHVRHTLEFFLCLEAGHRKGVVNYDNRAHDRLMEGDKEVALDTIRRIRAFVSALDLPLNLILEVAYEAGENALTVVGTNSRRELVYNIEHAVHHMAIMKIGVREVAPYVFLSPHFGVAASTLRHPMADSDPKLCDDRLGKDLPQ